MRLAWCHRIAWALPSCGAVSLFLACGARTIGDLPAGASESQGCPIELSWERRFAGEPGLLLGDALQAPSGPVAVGRHFDGPVESTAVVALSGDGAVRWQRQLEGRWPRVARMADRIVVGRTEQDDVTVTLLGDAGNVLRDVRFGSDGEDQVTSLLPTASGLYVFGSAAIYPSSLGGLHASRLGAEGDALWTKIWDPVQGVELRSIGAFADAQGRLVVAAQRWLKGGGGPPAVIALDESGQMLWEFVATTSYERGSSWALLPQGDGGLVLVGSIDTNGAAGGPAWALRLSASGALVWQRSFDDGSGAQQVVSDGANTSDGGHAFVGYSANSAQGRLWRVRADGSVAWTRDYPVVGAGMTRIRVLPSGGFVVGAARWSLDGDDLYEVLQLDAQGELVLRRGSAGEGVTFFGALDVDAGGRVLAVGAFSNDADKQSHVMLFDTVCGGS
jgi:hypothetical protein